MKALGLNQSYMLLKLRNNYYIVLICSFASIHEDNITAINKKCIVSLYLNNTDDFGLIMKTIWILKSMKITTFCRFSSINILDNFLDLISE